MITQTMTALMIAIRDGRMDCVEALIAAKADVDIQDVSYARLFACPVTLILCLYADYYVNIVVCNPSLVIFFMGYWGD
jgi:hypothetical protein